MQSQLGSIDDLLCVWFVAGSGSGASPFSTVQLVAQANSGQRPCGMLWSRSPPWMNMTESSGCAIRTSCDSVTDVFDVL